MKEFLQRTVAFIMLAVYTASVAPASEIALAHQAERRTLDAYLERAQVQTDKERFEKIAQQGLGAAVAEWEQNSLELKLSDYDEWLLQKAALEEDLQTQKDLSFAAWAQKKQNEQKAQIQKTALYDKLQKAALEFAFVKGDGNATRIVSKEFIGEAKAQWNAIAQKIVQEHIAQWNAANDYDALLQNEFLAMENAITNSLVNELLYDHASLKKLSDAEAAAVIAQQLADDVDEQTGASMAALFNSMQTELQGADQDAASSAKEKEWLEKFEKELQAGLAKWDEAERSFLASRVEWEQNAENVFLNDNQKWQEAYNELERRKAQWAEKIEKQIQDGKAQWKIKLANLENEINQYFEEFQYKLALELQQKEQLVDAGIATYNQSRQILVMAQNAISNWYARWGEKYRGLYSYWKTEDQFTFGQKFNLNATTTQDLRNEINKWKNDYNQISKSINKSVWNRYDFNKSIWNASQELFEWLNLYDTYSAQAKNTLQNLYQMTGGGVASSDYDEIENEKTKLAALESYWQSRVEVAESVLDYAENSSSSAEVAQQTKENLNAALERYEQLKAQYQEKAQSLYALQDQIEQAQDNYFAIAQQAQEILENLETQRTLYDELYAQWSVLSESCSFENFLSFNDELESIEMNDLEFEETLQEYAEYLKSKEAAEMNEKIQAIKFLFENGSSSYTQTSVLTKEEQEALGLQNAQSEQTELEEKPQEILSTKELIKRGGHEKELKEREAILVLIDGSLEEIEKYFANHPELQETYQNYKCLSRAVFLQEQQKAKTAVLAVISQFPKESLYTDQATEEYFAALNSAGAEFGSAGKTLLEMYKKAVLDKKTAQKAGIEADLMAKINNNYADKNLVIKTKNYHTAIYESLFQTENFAYDFQGTPSSNGNELFLRLDTSSARAVILSRMQAEYEVCLESQKVLLELNKNLQAQQQRITQTEKDYQQKTELLRGASSNSAMNLYLSACNRYNSALQECQNFYDTLESARRDYRVAQEIYFYAENEYLHGNVDLETPLEQARQKLLESRTALEVLEEVKAEREADAPNFDNCTELNNYKESAKQYYKARVLAYEYEQETAGQKERLYQMQLAEQTAMGRLVCEYSDNMQGTEFQIPALASDFVNAKKVLNEDGTFSYSFELNSVAEIDSIPPEEKTQSQEVLKEYYTDFCITTKDIYENEYTSSRAKNDALEFLCSLEKKNYSLEDLALALLYLKMQGNDEQKSRWLQEDENPDISANYPTGDIPQEIHSVDIWGAYNDGRNYAMRDAYNKVMANGGEQDIVNYILYSQTNISSSLELYQRQHDALSIRGLETAVKRLNSREDYFRQLAAVQLGLVSTYSAIVCIPFGFGAWAAGLLAAAIAVYAVLNSTANKIREVKNDVREVQRGYAEWSEKYQKSQETYFNAWKSASTTRKAEEQRYYILLSGKEKDDGTKITWKNFKTAVKELANGGNSPIEYSYVADMHSENSKRKNLKSFFYEVTDGENFTTIGEVISKMHAVLQAQNAKDLAALNEFWQTENEKKEAAQNEFRQTLQIGLEKGIDDYKNSLKTAAQNAWGKNSFDKKLFNFELLSLYGDEILPALPVRLGEETESHTAELFENIKQIYLSQAADEIFAKADIKAEYLSLLQNDMQEQYELWLDKITTAAMIGIEEWQRADENLNAAYNFWQKEWIDEYAQKNSEWDANYKEFLQAKQNWINQSYLQAGIKDPIIANHAAVSKMSTSTGIENSISDYVSLLYDKDKFARIADFAQTLMSFAGDESDAPVFTFDKADYSSLKNFDQICKMQEEIENDMTKAAAKYQAEILEMQAEEELKKYFALIKEKNKSIEDWELEMVLKAGYRVDSEIHRNAIVDSTAFSTIREKQTVHRYQYFETTAPEISFSTSDYQGTTEFFIMKKIEEIQIRIQDWQERIFGKTDESGNAKTKGQLNEHIGEKPVFIKNIDLDKSKQENLKYAGSGQMGLIMSDFLWNSMKNSQGYAELAKPVYDQKLTSGDSWFQLPTIREMLSMVCDIVANAGYDWFRYVDDIIFGAMDLGMGYKDFDEVANSFIQQGATAAVSYGISAAGAKAFSAIGTKMGIETGKKGAQILGAAKKAAVSYTNSVASSYINSFNFVRGTMDWEQANSVWTNSSNYASAAGTLLSGKLGEKNNVDGKNLKLKQTVFGGIENMNAHIGSLSSAALNYLYTGDISFNLAKTNGIGLFEIGIKNGEFGAGISRGGTNFALLNTYLVEEATESGKTTLKAELGKNAIQDIAEGAKTARKVSELKNSGIEEQIVNLNSANLLAWSGTENNIELAKKLFGGEQEVVFAQMDSDTLSAMDGDKIIINSKFLSDSNDNQATTASLIAYQNALKNNKEFFETDTTAKEKSDNTISSLVDMASAFAVSHKLLNSEYNSNENTENLQMLAELYNKAGIAGAYVLYAAIKDTQKKTGGDMGAGGSKKKNEKAEEQTNTEQEKITITAENVMRPEWYQNDAENKDELLGFSKSKEEYIAEAKQKAAERYAEDKIKKMGVQGQNADAIKEQMIDYALSHTKMLERKGYLNTTTLSGYGCTLSTAAYIAYSITGNVVSLKEANEILKEKKLFYSGTDKNGITQANLVGMGEGYVAAVNAIAGGDYLAMDGTQDTFSEKKSEAIFKRLISNSKNANEVYFTHMRIDNETYDHSVLFKSMTYENENDYKSATLNVYNPWNGGWAGRTQIGFKEVTRADFYKLTNAGKEIYNQIRGIST